MWYVVFIVLVAIPVILWNFVPSIRAKTRGWSTMLEATLGGVIYALGQATDGLKELQSAGYLPGWLVAYLPYVFIAWVIAKRLQTKTPVGKKY